jgi:hypothetical protein
MINSVRNTVLDIINKDNNGYVTPDEFNNYAIQAQREIFEEYFTSYAMAVQKTNARIYGSEYADIKKRLEAVIDIFNVPAAPLTYNSGTGTFPAPTDLYKMERLTYNGSVEIEKVTHGKILYLIGSPLTAPSVLYPAYTLSSTDLTVYPSAITTLVTANYLRYPVDPKWTYVTVNDSPLFNPAAIDYQDFELPLSDEMNLIIRILQLAGVSIRENEVVQMAKAEEIQDKQEQ